MFRYLTGTLPSINENAPNGTVIGTLTGVDADNSALTYSIINPDGRFSIDPSTGIVSVLNGSLLNYENAQSHDIIVQVSDGINAPYQETFTVNLNNTNDNAPNDITGTLPSINENSSNGTVIGTLTGVDPDNSTLTYSIINPDGRFAIDASTGIVTVLNGSLLNYENAQSHDIVVQVSDGINAPYTETFTVNLNNVNDNAPSDITGTLPNINENSSNGTVIGTLAGVDPDNDTLTYSIIDNAGGRFSIDPSTGIVTVLDGSLLNYENASSHDIVVQVSDGINAPYQETFTVNLNNLNDNAPTLTALSKIGTEDTILSFTASDFTSQFADLDGDSLSSIRIDSLATNGLLKLSGVNVTAGQIISAANLSTLTFVPTTNYNGTANFTWSASDGSAYSTSSTATLNISAVNDAPTLINDSIVVNEDFILIPSSDFLVNTTTAGTQEYHKITSLSNGGFIVTWQDYGTANYDVRGRIFNADGTALTVTDFLLPLDSTGYQTEPRITSLNNGGFVVTWLDDWSDIKGRVFNADGTVLTNDFLINNNTAGGEFLTLEIRTLSNGNFVVAWTEMNGLLSAYDIRGKIFNADGTLNGSEFLINNTSGYVLDEPTLDIVALNNGGFVATWNVDDSLNYTFDPDVRGRVFNADGTPVTATDFLVSTTNANAQYGPKITSLSNGGFVATWEDNSSGNYDARARVFNADGTSVTANDFLLNTTTSGSQGRPQITSLSNGGFIATWVDNSSGSNDIRARIFNADGTAVNSTDFLVSTTNTGPQYYPQITSLSNGGFVATWTDSSDWDIRGRVFNADGTPVTATDFLLNTTTAGSQGGPEITSLSNGGFVVTWQDNSSGNHDIST